MEKLGLIVNKLFVKMSSDSALIEENLDKAKNMLLEKSQKVLMEEIQNTNTTEAVNIINSLIQTLNSASTQVNNITTKLETLNTPHKPPLRQRPQTQEKTHERKPQVTTRT